MTSANDNHSPMTGQPSGSTMASERKYPGAPGEAGTRTNRKSERGFASMDPARQRAIASQGGKAAHQSGNAHEFTSDEAREAGRKGGHASHANRRSSATGRQDSGPGA